MVGHVSRSSGLAKTILQGTVKEKRKKKEKEADRRSGGKTIPKDGQEWTLPAQLGQLKTEQDGKRLLRIHVWCPTTFRGYGIEKNRIETL